MTVSRRLALLIPAYNVRPWGAPFIARMNAAFARLRADHGLEIALVFVDDGSFIPGTQLAEHRAALSRLDAQVHGARHSINRGQGAALQTAIEVARSKRVDADYYVTFDSDGQHDPEDIAGMLETLRSGGLNIVFGNRFPSAKGGATGIPWTRALLLRLASAFERVVTGLDLADAHNGLRVFDRTTAERLDLQQDRMAHATEFKTIVSRFGLKYGEAPVTITYSAESLGAGQRNTDALRVLADLFRGWWFR